jgi:Tc5 transposase C-terminal domain
MNKNDLEVFMNDISWPNINQNNISLLVDSWTINKDMTLINKPEHVTLGRMLIPEKCTGLIQPLDVYFFRPYKNFINYITDNATFMSDFKIWQRDNFIKLQSLAFYQFCAPMFRNIIEYGFFKSGYTQNQPPKSTTPVKYCFDFDVPLNCVEFNCTNNAFFRYGHCENTFCLDHTLIRKVHNTCSIAQLST